MILTAMCLCVCATCSASSGTDDIGCDKEACAPTVASGVSSSSLLQQNRAMQRLPEQQLDLGCSSDAWFNGGVAAPAQGSANPWQFSSCNRSKLIFEDLQQVLAAQQWLSSPQNLLSFGCSVGYEAREARGRYPESDVWGYDIEDEAVESARAAWSMSNLTFTSNSSMLPGSFDLVMMNNVLYSSMSHTQVRSLFKELFSLAAEGGVVEITIFDPEKYCYPGDVKNSCEGFGFDPKIAWDVLHEIVRDTASVTASTNHGLSFMFVAKGPFNI